MTTIPKQHLMTKPYIPLLAFILLLWLTIGYPFYAATSADSGWHTTIFPPFFVWTNITLVVLLFVAIGYWLLSKRVDKINWTIFITHFLLTVPTIAFLKFPSIFIRTYSGGEASLRSVSWLVKLIPIARLLFLIGQVLFFVYFIRALRAKNKRMKQ